MNQPTTFRFLVEPDEEGTRLDVYLADQNDPPLSRSQVRRRLDAGEITVNDAQVKSGYTLREDDMIRWDFSPPSVPTLEAQKIPVDVLYEDASLAVVQKPAGMVVHPSPGHSDGTLVNALLYQFDDLAGIGGELRPGIVHRLDKDTSGALAVTKSDQAHRFLAEQFGKHTVSRSYHALVVGPRLEDQGVFDTFHARNPNNRKRFSGLHESKRRAITHYRVLERFDWDVCLVECRLQTGRTHQIRMHFFEANAPLLGDSLYGTALTQATPLIGRQALHARSLGFDHPDGSRVECESPYPADFQDALEALRAGKSWR
ncbi:RluA family pseudouridine synthase [Bradymonas sediminis]|uniref:Pseudouridine synthase n=1 Tax=Bradymonas sediminis TaxID=1548548 RepID=A0A2Z4FKF1_9DELT|nr:RluA family pseudouridine synthase [Bradymonas sediminis]AWV89206.1 RNA pseudouridine synthase [Bradymonas sediminis]TDP73373.1 ribosomal large subunit pseudouridine synthase D [Bradymonas sediminis]